MRTLLISLGGARYPAAPAFRHTAFGPSSRAIAKLFTGSEHGLVDSRDHLNLFDDDRSWPDQLIEARNWVKSCVQEGREQADRAPDNVAVHYVGHGWFLPNSEDHLLTINHTDADEKAATSAALGQLNAMLLREAGGLRRFYLIDACFAAASLRNIMAGDDVIEKELGVIIGAWPDDEAGKRGVAALCSADKDSLANAAGDRAVTQFTDGLLMVLEKGDGGSGDRITLRRLYELLRMALRATYGDGMVHPVLVAPNDSDGGIAGVPLFTNAHKVRGLAKAADAVAGLVQTVRDVVSHGAGTKDGNPDAAIEPLIPSGAHDARMSQHSGLSNQEPIDDRADDAKEAIRALEIALGEDVTFRRVVYRFFRLPPSKKKAIIDRMKLGRPGDAPMNELDRFKAALARARSDGQVRRLEVLIGEAEEIR